MTTTGTRYYTRPDVVVWQTVCVYVARNKKGGGDDNEEIDKQKAEKKQMDYFLCPPETFYHCF